MTMTESIFSATSYWFFNLWYDMHQEIWCKVSSILHHLSFHLRHNFLFKDKRLFCINMTFKGNGVMLYGYIIKRTCEYTCTYLATLYLSLRQIWHFINIYTEWHFRFLLATHKIFRVKDSSIHAKIYLS